MIVNSSILLFYSGFSKLYYGIIISQGTRNPCRLLNGRCEDKCSLNIKGAVECSCFNNRTLLPDKHRCVENQLKNNCSNNEFWCSSNECIPFENTCDGINHCLDESDEDIKYCGKQPNLIFNLNNCRFLHSSK